MGVPKVPNRTFEWWLMSSAGLLTCPTTIRLLCPSATWAAPAQPSTGTLCALITGWRTLRPAWRAARRPLALAKRWWDYNFVISPDNKLAAPLKQINSRQTPWNKPSVLVHIPALRPSRYFITARALATWWPQAWTCQQCWASVPGRATVITCSKSTWRSLWWGPSFLPAGGRQDTSYCSGLRFKETMAPERANLIYYRL